MAEEDLEQRLPREVTLGAQLGDEAIEGQVAVLVSTQHARLHLLHHLDEGGVARQVAAQHHRVEEISDEVGDLLVAAILHGQSHPHVLLAAPAGEQRLEGRHQHHEQRGLLAARQRAQPRHQLSVELEAHHAAAEARHHGSRAIDGQIQSLRAAGKAVPPVGELPIEDLALEPAPLPERIVGVLRGELGQLAGPSFDEGAIEHGQLAEEEAKRGTIDHEVMHVDEQQCGSRLQQEHLDAERALALQVEGVLGVLVQELAHAAPALADLEVRQVDPLDERASRRIDQLHTDPLDGVVAGAEDLVAAHHLGEGALEELHVEVALDPHDVAEVVGRAQGSLSWSRNHRPSCAKESGTSGGRAWARRGELRLTGASSRSSITSTWWARSVAALSRSSEAWDTR